MAPVICGEAGGQPMAARRKYTGCAAGGPSLRRGRAGRGAQLVDPAGNGRPFPRERQGRGTSLAMLWFALRNLRRRPLRNGLTFAGLAIAVAVLTCLDRKSTRLNS